MADETTHGLYLLWNMSDLEARDLCKHRIDTMEMWARRLLDETFKEAYGEKYFDFEESEDQPLVNTKIKRAVEGRIKSEPNRFPRKVDALVIENLMYFFCREDLYKKHFKTVFEPFYSSSQEVRNVLNRIVDIRNKIAHSNHLSQHELEQGVCYSNDFISVFSNYYKNLGKEKDYNVPTFISVRDSWGRCLVREDSSHYWEVYDSRFSNNSVSENTEKHLRSGESYRLILEVDTSFPADFFEISWKVEYHIINILAKGSGNVIQFSVNDSHVSYSPTIKVWLTTKRAWHKFASINCDDCFVLHLSEILPPIETGEY